MYSLSKRTSADGEDQAEVWASQKMSETWLTTIDLDQPFAKDVKQNLENDSEVSGGSLSFFDKKFIKWFSKGSTPRYHGHIGVLDEENEENGFMKIYTYESPKKGRCVYITSCRPFPRQNTHIHCDYNSTVQFLEGFDHSQNK